MTEAECLRQASEAVNASSDTARETGQMSLARRRMAKWTAPFRELLKSRETWIVIGLATVFLTMHLIIIAYGNELVSDEYYYVPEANSIIHSRQLLESVHPSLGKLLIAFSILLLGDNPWGWRLIPVMFGTVSVVLFYLISRKLTGKRTALVASLLLVTENLTFLSLGLAMLDVFSFTFMLLSFFLYLHNKYSLSGVSLALGGLCKVTGLFGGLAILGHWLFTSRRKERRERRGIVFLILFGVAAFLLLLPVSDFIATGEWLNPITRISSMVSHANSLKMHDLTGEARRVASYPWEWVMSPRGMYLFPDGLHYIYIVTPTIWVCVIPLVGYMGYEWIFKRKTYALFGCMWFGATYLVLVLMSLVTDRATYIFYFFPTLGCVCLAAGYVAQRIWARSGRAEHRMTRWLPRVLMLSYLVMHLFLFYVYSPIIAVLTPQWLPGH